MWEINLENYFVMREEAWKIKEVLTSQRERASKGSGIVKVKVGMKQVKIVKWLKYKVNAYEM